MHRVVMAPAQVGIFCDSDKEGVLQLIVIKQVADVMRDFGREDGQQSQNGECLVEGLSSIGAATACRFQTDSHDGLHQLARHLALFIR